MSGAEEGKEEPEPEDLEINGIAHVLLTAGLLLCPLRRSGWLSPRGQLCSGSRASRQGLMTERKHVYLVSIQPGRVLWRIVDEVDRTPRAMLPRSVFDATAFEDAAGGERIEVVRIPSIDENGAAPFATLLHFWTHALRDWLDTHGQADQLVGVGGYAMCEHVDEPTLRAEFAKLGAKLRPAVPALALQGTFVEAYRMMDGTCRASFVVATESEWQSVTWGHGFESNLVLPTLSRPRLRGAGIGWQLQREA
jgi:hypothetical protein